MFLACVVEGKKYQEVADELEISLNTVKKHMSRVLRFLREELKDGVVSFLVLIYKR